MAVIMRLKVQGQCEVQKYLLATLKYGEGYFKVFKNALGVN